MFFESEKLMMEAQHAGRCLIRSQEYCYRQSETKPLVNLLIYCMDNDNERTSNKKSSQFSLPEFQSNFIHIEKECNSHQNKHVSS